MSVLVRYEPVINRQRAIIASRLTVRASTTADALAELDRHADTWPATRSVILNFCGTLPDDALRGWERPANLLLELPAAAWIASPQLQALSAELENTGLEFCLGGFAPGMAMPPRPKFRYVFADGGEQACISHVPGLPLATGLADIDAFRDAIDGGYGGAAGWFFLRGAPAGASKLNPGHAQIIHILNLVRQNADLIEVESALKKDISISFKLLRYINSAGFGLATKIESFKHAVTLIGYNKLNKWLSLLLVTASRDPAASALMQTAIVRGRFMELVAGQTIERAQLDNLFITGSFSLLDVLLGSRLEVVMNEMNLPDAIVAALLRREGPYATFLELALSCEHDAPADLLAKVAALGLSVDTINRAQIEALAFADTLQME